MGTERNERSAIDIMLDGIRLCTYMEDAGAAVPEMWWMLHVSSRRCGVTVVRLAPRHGRLPDGRGRLFWWEDVPPIS